MEQKQRDKKEKSFGFIVMMLKEKEGMDIKQKTLIQKIINNSWETENYQLYWVEID